MTLQEIYDMYVANKYQYSQKRLGRVIICYDDINTLKPKEKEISAHDFFKIEKQRMGEKSITILNNHDYEAFNNALFEERECFDCYALVITIAHKVYDMQDYRNALQYLWGELLTKEVVVENIKVRENNIIKFYENPNYNGGTIDHDTNEKLGQTRHKYVYGYCKYLYNKHDDITNAILEDIRIGIYDADTDVLEMFANLDHKIFWIMVLEKIISNINDSVLRETYELGKYDALPDSEAVAEDYYEEIHNFINMHPTDIQYELIDRKFNRYCDNSMSYIKAHEAFEKDVKERVYPHMAFYEKEVFGDGSCKFRIIEKYDLIDDVNNLLIKYNEKGDE